jgi:hypothetical protein
VKLADRKRVGGFSFEEVRILTLTILQKSHFFYHYFNPMTDVIVQFLVSVSNKQSTLNVTDDYMKFLSLI